MRSFDGVPIAVHPYAATGNGPDIWLSHATGFCAACWTPVVDGLSALAGRIVGWDHRGHGGSGSNGVPVSWWDMGGDVLAIVDSFPRRDAPSIGVGHSMGAATLVIAEITRPGTFDAIVAVEPILIDPPVRRTDYPLAAVVRKRRRTFPMRQNAMANFERKVPFSRWHRDALDGYISEGLRDTIDGVELACHPDFEAEVYDTAGAHGAMALLDRVEASVHVVVGSESDTVDLSLAGRIVEALPQATLEVVEGAGHLIPMEQPDAVVAAVASVFAQNAE